MNMYSNSSSHKSELRVSTQHASPQLETCLPWGWSGRLVEKHQEPLCLQQKTEAMLCPIVAVVALSMLPYDLFYNCSVLSSPRYSHVMDVSACKAHQSKKHFFKTALLCDIWPNHRMWCRHAESPLLSRLSQVRTMPGREMTSFFFYFIFFPHSIFM